MYDSQIKTELGLKYPIYWNLAAIEPSFANQLIYKIISSRPKVVVEVGAGLSTVITLKTLKNLGIPHKLYAYDADEWFLNETKNILKAEELYNPEHVKLIYAPIEKVKISGKSYIWHKIDTNSIEFNKIDLLTVDGPVGDLTKESRYPAVPFFDKWFSEGTSIILDDFNRDDERSIVKKWLNAYPNLEFIYRGPTQRGQAEMIYRSKNMNNINKKIPEQYIPAPPPDTQALLFNQLNHDINSLRSELSNIQNSRSWKLASKMSGTYNKIRLKKN